MVKVLCVDAGNTRVKWQVGDLESGLVPGNCADMPSTLFKAAESVAGQMLALIQIAKNHQCRAVCYSGVLGTGVQEALLRAVKKAGLVFCCPRWATLPCCKPAIRLISWAQTAGWPAWPWLHKRKCPLTA